MRLTVIGCSGGHPGPDSACSSYLVEQDGFRLLLDLGNGALGELQRHADPRDVDALFLSHLHGDHWLDLVPLSHARRHHPDGRVPPPLPVYAPTTGRDRITGAFGNARLGDVFDLQTPADRSIGPFAVRFVRTVHPLETHAVRVEAAGRALVYTADTGWFADLVRFAQDADVLLAEAGFADGAANPSDVHLTATQTGELAKAANVGRLVVTHVAPWHDAGVQRRRAAAAFGGPTDLARPGATFDV
ncbi:MAG TPA: MBL fold metallo-hydrolase [Acidothermaceae bacterium]